MKPIEVVQQEVLEQEVLIPRYIQGRNIGEEEL